MAPKKCCSKILKKKAFEYSHRLKKETITLDSGEDTHHWWMISRYCEGIKLSKRIKLIDK